MSPLLHFLIFQVAPYMFLAFSIVPHHCQSSYVGENGLLFSYYTESNQTFALFANSSYTSINAKSYNWYRQHVSDDNGMRFGEAIETTPVLLTNSTWYYDALSSKNGYASWGLSIGEKKEPLFIYTTPVKESLPRGQRGVLSLGVPVKVFTNFISTMDLYGGHIFSATEDGHFLVQTGPPSTSITFSNDTITVQLVKSKDNVLETTTIRLQCKLKSLDASDILLIASNVNIWGIKYEFYCTLLEIAGLRSVSHINILACTFYDIIFD